MKVQDLKHPGICGGNCDELALQRLGCFSLGEGGRDAGLSDCFMLISDMGTLSGQRRLAPRAVLHSEKLG